MHRTIDTIPSATMDALCRYRGRATSANCRNCIERAVILSPGPVLQVPLDDLRSGALPSPGAGAAPNARRGRPGADPGDAEGDQMGACWPEGGGSAPGPEPLDAGLSHEQARDCPSLAGRGRRRVRRRGVCQSAGTWEPVRTALSARGQPSELPCSPMALSSRNALRGGGVQSRCLRSGLPRLAAAWRCGLEEAVGLQLSGVAGVGAVADRVPAEIAEARKEAPCRTAMGSGCGL